MAKCKHENVDHLFPGDYGFGLGLALVEQFRCIECHAWLSLGPANVTPEVEIEIRAAQIVADEYMLWPEALGFDNDDDAEPIGPREYSPTWHAGYLARCIFDHDKDHP